MGAKPGSIEGDELDALATLVAAYEEKHHAVDAPDPVTAILFRMEQQHLTRRDLEPLIGTRARVSEILTRKRKLTIPMIRRVRSELGISADLLIEPVPMKAGRRHANPIEQRRTSARKVSRARTLRANRPIEAPRAKAALFKTAHKHCMRLASHNDLLDTANAIEIEKSPANAGLFI